MTCSSPYRVRLKSGLTKLVGCGHCRGCRIARSREWAVRIVHEMMAWKESTFATLTYNDDDLPALGTLDQAEFTKFWKRLRKSVGRSLRYYGCGEYGMVGERPHYHAIIFGVSAKEADVVRDSWGHGFVKCGSVTYESARYVADYIGKFDSRDYDPLKVGAKGFRQKPFAVTSLGLGRGFALAHGDELRDVPRLVERGKEMGLPRYYVKLLNQEGSVEQRLQFQERRFDLTHAQAMERVEWHRARCDGSPSAIRASMEASARQRGIDTEARNALRRGK